MLNGARRNPPTRRGDALANGNHRRDLGSVDFDAQPRRKGQQSFRTAVLQREVHARLLGRELHALQNHSHAPPFERLAHLNDTQRRPHPQSIGNRQVRDFDLRLLGIAALRYPVSQITGKLLPWTWAAFVVAAITGFGMFVTRAPAYVENPAFQIKFLLLPLACINMAIFHFRTFRRGIAEWDTAEELPPAARIAGGASLLLWAGIVLAGRWTGHLI